MTASQRSLLLQLRATQVVAGLASVVAAVALVAGARRPASIELGPTTISDRGVDVAGQRLDGVGVFLTGRGSVPSAATLEPHPSGGRSSLRSGDVRFVQAADSLNRRVTLTAVGLVRTELRIDTNTGALSVVRNVDVSGNPASEVITPLLGPLGQ
jgi:hypothetical protein